MNKKNQLQDIGLLSNYFISFCIQNNIPIDIVSEKLNNFKLEAEKSNNLNDTQMQALFIKHLPEILYKSLKQQAMFTGKPVKELIFENDN